MMKKLSNTTSKLCGWYDAAFRHGQETHQIPFINLKGTCQALCSKSCSWGLQSQDISSLPSALSLQFADAYLQCCGWLGILPLKGGYCSPKI